MGQVCPMTCGPRTISESAFLNHEFSGRPHVMGQVFPMTCALQNIHKFNIQFLKQDFSGGPPVMGQVCPMTPVAVLKNVRT